MASPTTAALALVTAFAAAPDHTRTCDTRAEAPGPPFEARPATDVILGRVTFLGLRRRIGLNAFGGSDPIAKVPVVIETGAPVTVRIRMLGGTSARLDFDREEWPRRRRRIARGAGQLTVRFEPCPPDTERFSDGRPLGDHTFYPGGFLVARRGCARLVARAPGEETVRRRVALGVPPRRCD